MPEADKPSSSGARRAGWWCRRSVPAGKGLQIVSAEPQGFGQQLHIKGRDGEYSVYLPLVGRFQADNAVMAVALVVAAGGSEPHAVRALEQLCGATGRLELVAATHKGAPVFVDYAHTPDALEHALDSLRPYVTGKLYVVFGAGGDRDKGKRPEMGAVAARAADVAIVTDDNPRSEDPSTIRAEIMAACPEAAGNRRQGRSNFHCHRSSSNKVMCWSLPARDMRRVRRWARR
jgi:UDP-N-acetylmuramoyl-L-alanyl-D-glutamate--2,6-diaminopimelate ligase